MLFGGLFADFCWVVADCVLLVLLVVVDLLIMLVFTFGVMLC